MRRLFNHLGSPREQRRRDVETKRLCRLYVDHQFVLGRRLYRQFGRLLIFEDTINIAGSTSDGVVRVWPITNQTTIFYKIAEWINGGPARSGTVTRTPMLATH
jgi:hypothetical protein